MTDEPKTKIPDFKKLDIPNFNEEDSKHFNRIMEKYPSFDKKKDIIFYPYLALTRHSKTEKPYAYDGKRCIVAECKGNDSVEHHEHMMHIYGAILPFLSAAYNIDRTPDPLSSYIQGVFTVLTELLFPLSQTFHKDSIDTEMVKNTLEELSNQVTSVSEWLTKAGMVNYRAQYDDSKIDHIKSADELEKTIRESDTLLMIDFWADWCGPCHALNPILMDLSHEMSDKIKIVKVNVDDHEKISKKFNVESMPTLILFKNGKELNRIVGVKDKESLVETIKSELFTKEVK